jgi:hypothetical protein
MTNVFKFPEHKIVREIPPQIEEIEKAKEKGKQNYAEDIVTDFVENMLSALDSYGIDQDNKNFDKDLAFAVEAIRATIYRSLSLEHHLHAFIDTHISILKKDDSGNLYIDAPENMEEMEEIIVAEIEKIDTDKESVDLD